MQKISRFLVIFLILTGAFFVVSEAQAITGYCVWTWPQKVTLDGVDYTCGSGRNYCNYTKAQLGIGECCANAEPYSNCAPIGREIEVNTEFSIDAWGYGIYGWVECINQNGTKTQLDAYCKSKGHVGIIGGVNACYHATDVIGRWTWNGAIPMVKGTFTNNGYALTKVKCVKSYPCAENWSCGAWSACSNGQQTRTCVDSNDCQTTDNKPITTQGCESLSCDTPIPGQEVVNYYKGDGTGEQFMCNSLYSHCKIYGMVGRCCPAVGSPNIDCMVMYPVRTILQGDGAADKKTLTVGETWPIKGGLALKAESIDAKANPRQVWVSLYNKGLKLDDKVIEQSKFYLYTPNSFQSYTDFNLFGVYIDSIFAGATSNMVQLRYAYHNSLWESGISCMENWSCGEWSTCSAGNQTRTCADANSCGTTVSKPAVSQSCTCAENWTCSEWSTCANSQQTRTCMDNNICGTTASKPTVSQSCTAICTESWSCGAWSTCSAGNQTRTCTDANNCGTTIGKPAASQSCSIIIQSSTTLDISCPSLKADDMVKVTSKPAIYVLNSELKVLYFPSGDEFKSWRPTYGGYISITEACFDSLPIPTTYPAAVNFRPGSYVLKKVSADQLYVVEPNNTLAKITSEAAVALYGADYKVMSVADVFWPHYINRGADVATAIPHPGMLIKKDEAIYYVDTGSKLRKVDDAGLTTNEFQTKFVRTVVSSAVSDFVSGENISDKVSALTDKTQSSN